MVKRILDFVYKRFDGLHEAALLLAFSALASQILALFRDRLLAGSFGAGKQLDIYYAAFRIPDLVYVLAVSIFVSVAVLIPIFLEKISDNPGEARKFLNAIFSIFSFAISIIAIIVFFLVPFLANYIAPGFSSTELEQLILLTRVLLLSPILLGLSGIFSAIIQSFNKFFIYALVPIVYNLGIIFGIIFLYPKFGLLGLAFGVLLGAFLHLSVQIPAVIKSGFIPRFEIIKNFNDVKKVLKLSLPRSIGLSVNQLVITIMVALASKIDVGSITVLTFAFNLQSVSLSVIGASYSVAAFPTLARFFTENRRKEFMDHIKTAGRHIIFWSLPVIALFIVLRAQIVRVILGTGAFNWTDTRLVAAALAIFAISLLAQSLILLFVRGYYAAGKTKKPIIVNIASSVFILAAIFVFLKIFNLYDIVPLFFENLLRVDNVQGSKVLALPLAYSLGMLINGFLLFKIFEHDFGLLVGLRRAFWQGVVAAFSIGVTAYFALTVFDDIFDLNSFVGIFWQGFLSGIIGIIIGIIILKLMRSRELKEVSASLHRKFWKSRPIAPEQEEL